MAKKNSKSKSKKKATKATGVMAKWGKIKWQCTTKKIMPIEDDLSITYEVNDKNKKQAQQISFSYIPKAAMGVDVKKEIERWSSLVGKVNPLYIGTKRFGPKKLKLKSVSASDIAIYGPGKATQAGITLNFEEKKGIAKKNSNKKKGKTKSAKKTKKKK